MYRFRVLNASISRGLPAAAEQRRTDQRDRYGRRPDAAGRRPPRSCGIGMAERYEIVIDFSKYTAGHQGPAAEPGRAQLHGLRQHRQDHAVRGRGHAGRVPADVTCPAAGPLPEPEQGGWDLKENAIQGTTKIEVVRQNGEWKIHSTSTSTTSNSGSGSSGGSGSGSGGSGSGSGSSGSGSGSSGGGAAKLMTWEDIIASGYKEVVANPASDDVQIWEITNKSGGWFHPVHIHLVDFKMLTRNGKPVFNYEQGPRTSRTWARTRRSGRSCGSARPRPPPRPVHGPLPQPAARGPRHDDAVPGGRRRRPRPALRPGRRPQEKCNDPINADPAGPSPA